MRPGIKPWLDEEIAQTCCLGIANYCFGDTGIQLHFPIINHRLRLEDRVGILVMPRVAIGQKFPGLPSHRHARAFEKRLYALEGISDEIRIPQ